MFEEKVEIELEERGKKVEREEKKKKKKKKKKKTFVIKAIKASFLRLKTKQWRRNAKKKTKNLEQKRNI